MYSKESENAESSPPLNIEIEQVDQIELRGEAEDQRSWPYSNRRSFQPIESTENFGTIETHR